MSTAQDDIKQFEFGSAFAFTAFLAMLVQALLRVYRQRKSVHKVYSPVMLSAVSYGEEPPELDIADDGPKGPKHAQPNQEGEKILQDKIQALFAHARSPASETTPEITRAAAIYLQAAENLLTLRHGGGGPGSTGTRKTRAELHAAAAEVVSDASGLTGSLLPPKPPENKGSRAQSGGSWAMTVFVNGLMSALLAAKDAEYKVFGDQGVDLTRFTLLGEPRAVAAGAGLSLTMIADAMSTAGRAFFEGTRTTLRLLVQIAMVPLYAAFNHLAWNMQSFGLPLSIVDVFILSLLATPMVMMPILVCEQPDEDEDEPGSDCDDFDEHEDDIGP